jgi:hypothetical protein
MNAGATIFSPRSPALSFSLARSLVHTMAMIKIFFPPLVPFPPIQREEEPKKLFTSSLSLRFLSRWLARSRRKSIFVLWPPNALGSDIKVINNF